MDRHRPPQRRVAGAGKTGRRQFALGGVDHEKPTIQAALLHAGKVGLAEVLLIMVEFAEVPAAVLDPQRHVEVGIEHDRLLVEEAVLGSHVTGLR